MVVCHVPFYVWNQAEIERSVVRHVINLMPLNKVLQYIRYPIHSLLSEDFKMLQYIQILIWNQYSSKSKLIKKKYIYHYKTTIIISFGHYKWDVMSFELKYTPSKLHNIMNNIFNLYLKFMIIYIDDVLLILKSITKYFNNLQKFLDIIKQNGLVISTLKMMSIKNNFFRYNIY
jgi:hypothetical protein